MSGSSTPEFQASNRLGLKGFRSQLPLVDPYIRIRLQAIAGTDCHLCPSHRRHGSTHSKGFIRNAADVTVLADSWIPGASSGFCVGMPERLQTLYSVGHTNTSNSSMLCTSQLLGGKTERSPQKRFDCFCTHGHV